MCSLYCVVLVAPSWSIIWLSSLPLLQGFYFRLIIPLHFQFIIFWLIIIDSTGLDLLESFIWLTKFVLIVYIYLLIWHSSLTPRSRTNYSPVLADIIVLVDLAPPGSPAMYAHFLCIYCLTRWHNELNRKKHLVLVNT